MTPREALDAIQSRLEAYESRIGQEMSDEMSEAINTLHSFIKQVEDHGSIDLEWGEPGDCWDRIVEDEDTRDAINDLNIDAGLPYYAQDNVERIRAAARQLGLGRHYGDPHCIYCLQGN